MGSPGTNWRLLAALGALAYVLLLAFGWPAREYLHTDFFSIWAGSRATVLGADPYDLESWRALHAAEGSRALDTQPQHDGKPIGYAYPPWTALALAPLGLLPVPLAAPLWLAAQAAAVITGLAALSGRRPNGDQRPAFVLAGLTVAFQPAWVLVVGGNMSGYLLGLLCWALWAAREGRSALAGALVGALVLKPHPLLLAAPLALAAMRHGRGAALRAALLVAGSLVAASLALRPSALGEWIATLRVAATADISSSTIWALDRVIGSGPATVAAPALVLVAAVALLVWWRQQRPSQVPLVAAALPLSILAAPRGWSYDQVLLLLTVAIALERTYASASPRRLLVALALVIGVLPWVLYALAFQRGGEELSVLVPLLLLAVFMAAVRRTPDIDARPSEMAGRE